MFVRFFSIALATLLLSVPANSATLFDSSPAKIGIVNGFGAQNVSDQQNFLTQVKFDRGVNLSGIANFSAFYVGQALLGTSVQVRIYGDSSGNVGNLLHDISSTISQVEDSGFVTLDRGRSIERNFAAFEQFLKRGTYWIGLMGTTDDIGQYLVNSNGTVLTANMQGASTFVKFLDLAEPQVFDAAQIQVYGSPIPLPASMPLLLGAVGAIGFVRRRKNA